MTRFSPSHQFNSMRASHTRVSCFSGLRGINWQIGHADLLLCVLKCEEPLPLGDLFGYYSRSILGRRVWRQYVLIWETGCWRAQLPRATEQKGYCWSPWSNFARVELERLRRRLSCMFSIELLQLVFGGYSYPGLCKVYSRTWTRRFECIFVYFDSLLCRQKEK